MLMRIALSFAAHAAPLGRDAHCASANAARAPTHKRMQHRHSGAAPQEPSPEPRGQRSAARAWVRIALRASGMTKNAMSSRK
jgi:hypothetical protein